MEVHCQSVEDRRCKVCSRAGDDRDGGGEKIDLDLGEQGSALH